MNEPTALKWYHRRGPVIVLLLSVGPVAFPLLWGSPAFRISGKVFWTVLTLVITAAAVAVSIESVKRTSALLGQLGLLG